MRRHETTQDNTTIEQPWQHERRLLARDEVISLLQLTSDQVQQLINTRQLLPIRIVGEERFCSKDLSNLIEMYRFTAARRSQ